MGKGIAIVVLVAVAGVGVGVVSMMNQNALEREIEAERNAGIKKLASADGTISDLRKEVSTLRRELEEARGTSPPIAQAEAASPAATAGAKAEGEGNSLAKMIEVMRDDPAMKEMMAKQQELMVDQVFGPLLEGLDLTEEEKAQFRALLVERQVAAMDQGFQLVGGDKSKEEKMAIARELGEQEEARRAEIRKLIGEENFEKFDLYEKSQQERQQISSFKESLAGTEQELTFEQEEALMSAMYEERKNFKFTTDLSNEQEAMGALTNLKPETVDRFMEETARLHESVYGRVAEILTPEQLEAFRKSQESFRSMQEFGVKMGLQMMGGQEEK